MDCYGRITQRGRQAESGGISTMDETFVFATKVSKSKNFYLGLAASISSGTYGYIVPYCGQITSCIVSIQDPVKANTEFAIIDLTTNKTLTTLLLPADKTHAYSFDMEIEVPAGSNLGVYTNGTAHISNPIMRVLISQKA